MHNLQTNYDTYPVKASPEEVTELKDKISKGVARSASVLITITDTNETGPVVKEVTYEVGNADGRGSFISFGKILPQGTEAVVKSKTTESGTEYLELVADLGTTDDDQQPTLAG